MLAIALDLGGRQVETDRWTLFAELDCQRQADISQSYYCDDVICFHYRSSVKELIFAIMLIINIAQNYLRFNYWQ